MCVLFRSAYVRAVPADRPDHGDAASAGTGGGGVGGSGEERARAFQLSRCHADPGDPRTLDRPACRQRGTRTVGAQGAAGSGRDGSSVRIVAFSCTVGLLALTRAAMEYILIRGSADRQYTRMNYSH